MFCVCFILSSIYVLSIFFLLTVYVLSMFCLCSVSVLFHILSALFLFCLCSVSVLSMFFQCYVSFSVQDSDLSLDENTELARSFSSTAATMGTVSEGNRSEEEDDPGEGTSSSAVRGNVRREETGGGGSDRSQDEQQVGEGGTAHGAAGGGGASVCGIVAGAGPKWNNQRLYPPMLKAKSIAWKFGGFFKEQGRLDLQQTVCGLCGKKQRYRQTPTNLMQHVQANHALEYTAVVEGRSNNTAPKER